MHLKQTTIILFIFSYRCLALYPNGNNSKRTSNISLFLRREDKLPLCFNIKFTLKIIGKAGKDVEQEFVESSFDFRSGQGASDLISHEMFVEKIGDILSDGNLKIGCDVRN